MPACTGLLAGLVFPMLLPGLPDPAWWAVACVFAVSLLAYRRLALSLFFCGLAWTGVHLAEARSLRDAVPTQRDVSLSGVVDGTPRLRDDLLEFSFIPAEGFPDARLRQARIRVRWYRDFPEVRPGQRWQLDLALKPARSRLNFAGTDPERALFARDVIALATVRDGRLEQEEDPSAGKRRRVIAALDEALDTHPSRPVVLALAVAERSGLEPEDWDRYRLTGTSHLFAISGLHVGLAAMLGFLAGQLLLWCLPVRLALRHGLQLPWLLAIASACWYAAMAGLQTSTRRALVMLLVIAALRLLARGPGLGQGLLVALAAVLALNPLAPLGAGFWLSFLAVCALLLVFAPRTGTRRRGWTLLRAQAGLAVLLAPASLYWFQQVPLAGMLVNPLAIPWVSVAVAPPAILAALLAPLDAPLARFPLFMAAEGARVLEAGLRVLEQGAAAVAVQGGATVIVTVLASLGAACLLLPRGMPQRFGGLLLLLPLLLPAWPRRDELRIDVLDVGQGLAVLVQERGRALLYDSGPGDGQRWSMVPGVIVPALAANGRLRPDEVIISHGDLDHAGGLHELRTRYPGADFMVNGARPAAGDRRCQAPGRWQGSAASYRVLHPSPGLPYIGNDSSCVLEINAPGGRVLLTGDMGASIEQRLMLQGLGRYDVLFAPHHGSRSSSSPAFIAATGAGVAVVSAGFANRFGLPHGDIRVRYRAAGVPLLNTADCGAIRLSLRPGRPVEISSARRQAPATWHWPAAEACP